MEYFIPIAGAIILLVYLYFVLRDVGRGVG